MKALLFASDGISFMANNDQTLEINGKGQLMGFIIHSNTEKALSNGDHYINLRPPYKEGDIAVGFYTMNWDEGNGVVFYEKTIGRSFLKKIISPINTLEGRARVKNWLEILKSWPFPLT